MDRREVLKLVALFTGSAMIGGETFLAGCTTKEAATAGWSASRLALLNEVGETILPQTSTPGAKAADVASYMQVIVQDCYTPAEKEAFEKGISQLDEASEKMFRKPFIKLDATQRHDLFMALEDEAAKYNKEVGAKDKPGREKARADGRPYNFIGAPKHYYTMMKQLTIAGFFSSEVGCKQALRYVPVPGKYDGAYPYKKGDRAFHE